MGEGWPRQGWREGHVVQDLTDFGDCWPVLGVFLATGTHKVGNLLRSMSRYHQLTSPRVASRLSESTDLQRIQMLRSSDSQTGPQSFAPAAGHPNTWTDLQIASFIGRPVWQDRPYVIPSPAKAEAL